MIGSDHQRVGLAGDLPHIADVIAEQMHEELADVIITALVTAHELGVDINEVLDAKLRTIFTRGWRAI